MGAHSAGGGSAGRLTVPDLGLPGVTVVLSLWLVPEGSDVVEGDRVVELLAGGVTVDLEAPVSGRMVRTLVDEDEAVMPGVLLAEFIPSCDAAEPGADLAEEGE